MHRNTVAYGVFGERGFYFYFFLLKHESYMQNRSKIDKKIIPRYHETNLLVPVKLSVHLFFS